MWEIVGEIKQATDVWACALRLAQREVEWLHFTWAPAAQDKLIIFSFIDKFYLPTCIYRLNCVEMSRHIICSGIWRQQRQWDCALSLPQSAIRRSLRSLSPDAVETPHQYASRSRRLPSDRSVFVTMCSPSKNIQFICYVGNYYTIVCKYFITSLTTIIIIEARENVSQKSVLLQFVTTREFDVVVASACLSVTFESL